MMSRNVAGSGDIEAAHAARSAQALLAAGAAAYATGARVEDILSRKRNSADAAAARQLAMYLMHAGFGVSLSHTAIAFGRDRSTVSHAVRIVEERREDPAFDALADALEAMMHAAPSPAPRSSGAPAREIA